MSYNSSEIGKYGGSYAVYAECDASGTLSGSYTVLPIIQESTFSDSTDIEDLTDEGGSVYPVNSTRNVEWTLTFLQDDAATQKLATHTLKNKYVQLVKLENEDTINSEYKFRALGIGKVVSNLEKSAPGSGGASLQLRGQKNSSQLTIDMSSVQAAITAASLSWGPTATGTVTIDASDYWNMHEQS